MRAAILRSGMLLTLAALGSSAATAQTELFFATGVDSTGWAQAQSNADGHVLIESPQYPRGLWLHLVDEAGEALAGLQIEYQGRPDSLVAIRYVDPAGGVRETLVWTRPEGDPLRLTLKPRETADLSAELIPVDSQIDRTAVSLLEPVAETRLESWEAIEAFLRTHWQSQTGRVVVQLDASTSFAVELDRPEIIETLVAHLQRTHQLEAAPLGGITPIEVQIFEGILGLREGLILSSSLFKDAALEAAVRHTLGRPQGRLTPKDVASLTALTVRSKDIHSLAGLEHLTILQRLVLDYNRITDLTPLVSLENLTSLYLNGNQIVDLTPLASLKNLTALSLWQNRITDLTPLVSLENLTSLYLNGNQIVDLTPLVSLKNLTSLHLDRNQIVDLTPLTQLNNLQTLSLGDNPIVDLTPLIQLDNLTGLYLGDVMCDFYTWTSPSKSSGFRLRRILRHTQIEGVSILVVHRLCKCHASRTFMVCTWKRCTNWA